MSILLKFAAALLVAALPAIAQEGSMKLVFNSADEQADQNEITITASRVVFERESGLSTFSGNVVVSQDGLTISADTVQVYAVENNFSEIDYLVAKGSLKITSDGGVATAETGTYTVASNTIELNRNVIFRTEDSTLSGESLSYNVETGESRLTGSASATIDASGE